MKNFYAVLLVLLVGAKVMAGESTSCVEVLSLLGDQTERLLKSADEVLDASVNPFEVKRAVSALQAQYLKYRLILPLMKAPSSTNKSAEILALENTHSQKNRNTHILNERFGLEAVAKGKELLETVRSGEKQWGELTHDEFELARHSFIRAVLNFRVEYYRLKIAQEKHAILTLKYQAAQLEMKMLEGQLKQVVLSGGKKSAQSMLRQKIDSLRDGFNSLELEQTRAEWDLSIAQSAVDSADLTIQIYASFSDEFARILNENKLANDFYKEEDLVI